MRHVQVRKGVVALVLEPGMVQVGTHPHRSVLFTNLSAANEQWLLEAVRQRPQLAVRHLSTARAQLLDRLRHVGLLEGTGAPSVLDQLRVRVVGLDRVGVTLVRLLHEDGLRYLDLRDRRLVDVDVEAWFAPSSVGDTRQSALQAELRGTGAFLSRLSAPHLVVTVEGRAVDHQRAGSLLSEDLPHLPIVVDDDVTQVGPLSFPGVGPCFLCVDLHRTEVLPNWPYLREQLIASAAAIPSGAQAHAAASMAALLAVEAAPALVAKATPPPTIVGRSWAVGPGGCSSSVWMPHGACLCRGV